MSSFPCPLHTISPDGPSGHLKLLRSYLVMVGAWLRRKVKNNEAHGLALSVLIAMMRQSQYRRAMAVSDISHDFSLVVNSWCFS
jgi:hypothetical protein